MAKESREAKKPGSGSETDKRPDRRSGDEPDRRLKKAVDRPIGQPEDAREEAPIGWDFGPDGPPLDKPGDIPGERVDVADDNKAVDETATASVPTPTEDASGGKGGTDEPGEGEPASEGEPQTAADDQGKDSDLQTSSIAGDSSTGRTVGSGDWLYRQDPGPPATAGDGLGRTDGPDLGGSATPQPPGGGDGRPGGWPGETGGPDGGTGGPDEGSGGTGEIPGSGGGDTGPDGGAGARPPVIAGPGAGDVQEDVILTTSGQLAASGSGGATWSIIGKDTGSYGGFTLGPDGSWSYALDNKAAQGLGAGETVQEIFTVKVTDASGASDLQTVTVTITGSNDAPAMVSSADIGAVGEDDTLSTSGKFTSADPDVDDTASWSMANNGEGHYGSFTLNPDGSWSYALDNDSAQGLRAGETVQEIFTVTVTDSAGASDTQTIKIVVTGTNDIPVISGTETGLVQEDEALTASGTLTASDADIGDTANWSVIGSSDGQYGNLLLGDDGSWTYTLDNDAAQGLKAGETAQEIFTVKVTDAEGASATQTITVTVTGTNDAPVISGTETGLVQEDEMLSASGTLTVTDPDIGDTAAWSVVGNAEGSYGALTLGDDGNWTYALDNDRAQGLRAGETVQEIFTVKVTDAEGASATQTVTVTVTGTNDTPVISGAETGLVQEDGTLTASGELNVADPDIGDTATWSVVGAGEGSYGSFTLNPDGSWFYALNNDAAQGLKAGETAQEIFTVKVTDAEGASDTQTITVTVTGTNDAPVISGAATGAVQEDEALTASGTLTSSDADVGDTANWSVVGSSESQYGSLVLGDDGQWSYTLNNDAAQGLKAGETAQEIFTVKVTDAEGASATQTITVTVTGTNDTPVISGAATGAVQEDEALTASGRLTATDPDIGDSTSWSVVGDAAGSYGALTLNPDGSWSYALNNDAAQGLKAGESVEESFTVRVTDVQGASADQVITVTVSGTNDIPVISGAETGSVQEDATLTASGRLTGSDADIGDTASWSVVGDGDGSYGHLALGDDGSWTYTLDNDAAQGLKAGDSAQEIFTVKVTDSAGASTTQTITVTVTGTNDAPVISGTETGAVQEDATLSASGTLTSTDPDIGDTAAWSVVGSSNGSYGSLVLGDNGQWSYALNNDAAQGLKAGETAQEIFTVKVTDASGASDVQTITVTVNGTNDAPVISGTETGSVQEDETLSASGSLTASDPDIGDTAAWSVAGPSAGTFGSLVLGDDGQWSYALNNDAAQGLKAGETAQEIFTVKVADASGASDTQTVTITVTGTNDVPVISGTATGIVQEDEIPTVSGALTSSDADIGDTATWSVVGSGEGHYGSLVLGDDGAWSYTLDNDAAQGLKAGDSAQEIFTVKVTDAAGAEVTQTITVTVNGTNDDPVISGAATGAVGEDGVQTASGALTSTDADIGDSAAWSIVGNETGAYGSLTIGEDGHWNYTLDNDTAQGLKEGETAQDIFTVKVTDASGASALQTVTVTVTGTNDVPAISGAATGSVQEDGTLTAGGSLTASDADIGDTATWSVVGDADGSYGNFTLGADGQWTYTLNNNAAQGLKEGDSAQDIFTVKVTDSAGAETTQTITVTVNGTNDVPVISGTETGSVEEDGTLTAGGRLDVSDADIGDTVTWSVVGNSEGAYGSLTLNQDGSWSYALDNDAAQGLKAGDNAQEIFTVKVTDSAGAEVTQTITVTVTGTNDVPAISGTETGSVQEDETSIASGSLTVTDADAGDTASWALVGSSDGSYGALTLDPDGSWSYALNNDAAQGLKEGETAQEIFTVRATDSAGASDTQTVTITVTGTNDAPVISGTATGTVQEDGTLTAGGKLDVFDADTGDTASWSVVGGDTGQYGSLTIDENGHWSYALDNDKAQGLKAGETAEESFTVRVTDSAGASAEQTITITVGGTNDIPVISGTSTGQVQEDVTLTASGTLTATDADIGDTASWSVDGATTSDYGVFAVDDSGHWTFTLNNDTAQGLKAGETIHETFTVTATDSAGGTESHLVSVDITGTNDGPQVGQALNNMGSIKEDTSVTFSAEDLLRGAQVTDIDQDHLTITTVGLDGSSAPGTLVDNGNGTWTFTPDHNVSNANAQIVFQVSDGHTSVNAQASVSIQPVADPADVTISSSAVQEVIKTGSPDDLGRIVAPQITTTKLPEFTLEFTVVGNSVPESTTGAGPVIVNLGSPPSDKNTLTLWDPANMKVGMSKLGGGDVNIATGINLTDGQSHRVTVTYDGATNTLKVYDNGDLALTTQLPKPLPNTLYMAVAEKANTPPTTANPSGGGYRTNEHFEGTIYNVAMSNKAETAEQVKEAPLAEQADDKNLLIDLRAQDGKIVDTTGHNSIKTGGAIDTDAVSVDTDLGSAPVGSVVHLDIDTTLEDPNDHISSLVISGFVAGTVVSDGVHSVTVTGPTQKIDITDWSHDKLTADLPDGVRTSMDLKVTATTTTPPFETGGIDTQGNAVIATDSATSDQHHTLMVEGAGPPPPTPAEGDGATATTPDDGQPGTDDTAVIVPGGETTDTSGGTSEGTSQDNQQQTTAPGTPAEGGDATTAPPDSSASTADGSDTTTAAPGGDADTGSDGTTGSTTTDPSESETGDTGTIVVPGTEPPISAGGGSSGDTSTGTDTPPTTGTQPGGSDAATGSDGSGAGSGDTATGGTSTDTTEPPTAGTQTGDGETTDGSGGSSAGGGSDTAMPDTEPPLSAGGDDTAGTTEPPTAGTQPDDGGTTSGPAGGDGSANTPDTQPPLSAGGGDDTTGGTGTGTGEPPTNGATTGPTTGGADSGGAETEPDTQPPLSAGGDDTAGGTSTGTTEPPTAGTQPDGGGTTSGSAGGDGSTTTPDTQPPLSVGGGNDTTGGTGTDTTQPPTTGTEPDDSGATTGSAGSTGSGGAETIPDPQPPLSAGGGDTTGGASTGTTEPPTDGTLPDGGDTSTGSTGGDGGTTASGTEPPPIAGGGDTSGDADSGGTETGPDTQPPLSAGGGDTTGGTSTGTTQPPTDGTLPDGGDTSTGSTSGDGGTTAPGTEPPLTAGGGDTSGGTGTGTSEPPTDGSDAGGGSETVTPPGSDGTATQPGDGGSNETGATTGPGTEPPISAGGDDTSGETPTSPQPGGDTGSDITVPGGDTGSEVAPPAAHEPVDASGDITFVSVNDWYNPSWGGGYNATFQLTLTDDMLKGGSLEGWSLQISLNNPNATVTTGWLDGFNGTVTFDPATGVFTNAGQDYQPELHAGDVIQFSIQVQNTGFNQGDLTFSFQDLDPVPEATSSSSPEGAETTAQSVDMPADTGDVAAAVASVAAFGMELHAQTASTSTNDAGSGTAQPQAATASAPAEATTHAEASTNDGSSGGTAQTADHAQTATDADHATTAVASVALDDQNPASGQRTETPLAGSHDLDRAAADAGHPDADHAGHIDHRGDHAGAGRPDEDHAGHMDQPWAHPDQPGHGDHGAEHGAGDIAAHAQPDAAPSSAANPYLEFVQPQAEDHGSGMHPADHPSSGADEYMHMAGGAEQPHQEPPPPDHLFADAQVEHGPASEHDAPDTHHGTPHDDAAASQEPPPIEEDHHHHHQ